MKGAGPRLRGIPGWAVIAAGAGLLVLAVLALLSSVYIGLAVVLVAAIGLAAVWAWTRLPERYGEGPDKAERAALDKRHQEMEEQREQREEEERRKRGEGDSQRGGDRPAAEEGGDG